MSDLLADLRHEFRRHKELAERALAALDDDQFTRRPTDAVNPVALIVKHVAGNLVSRFTDFLTSDGDKTSRDRDGEFRLTASDTRSSLMDAWHCGWSALLTTLDTLTASDLDRTITIRGEPHTVQQALLRSATHTAYHVGQITYLSRALAPDSPWLTIAPGQSKTHVPGYRKSAP
jgi:uncharacterized damage-inducible protein DinB